MNPAKPFVWLRAPNSAPRDQVGDAKKAPYPELKSGSIINYDYLWRWQHERGENEGRKPRECVIAIRTMVLESDTVFILPITATSPAPARPSSNCTRVPMPKRRAPT